MEDQATIEMPPVQQQPPVQTPPMPDQPPTKGERLYNNLIKTGFTEGNLGKKEDFLKALQNPIQANKIYSHLRDAGMTENNLGTLKEFQTSFAPDTPHDKAIQIAQQQRQVPKPKQQPKEDEGILDKVSNALYLPAFNQGFNELVVKPFLGASDFVGRTIDKTYTALTGEKTPEWLVSTNKNNIINNFSKDLDAAYQNRDKPKNLVSDVAEGLVGTLPLMASMVTGEGEASLATKAPHLVSKLTKVLATTGAANAYHDATERGEGYGQSLKEGAKGAAEGAEQGLTIDAQMLLGGAMGKGVVNKLIDKGLMKGGKAGEALIQALSTGTVFSGTSAGQDLLAGKDVDTHNALKNFGMGVAFELPAVVKGLNDEIGDRIDAKNAQKAALQATASNIHAESVLNTLANTPIEQLHQINQNITEGHEDLYTRSIEAGVKAHETDNPNEKNALLADQLLLKTQGDVKFVASHDKDELIKAVQESPELPPEQKQDLLNKLDILKQTENAQKNDGGKGGQSAAPEEESKTGQTVGGDEHPVQEGRENDEGRQDLKENITGEAQKAEPVNENQKAIDAVTHGILYSPDEKYDKMSPRFDFGMSKEEKGRAVRDIKKGNYNTAVAKKMLAKIKGWEENDEYPIIEGSGGNTQRTKSATGKQIQDLIDDAKANKIGELSQRQIDEFNESAKDLGITAEDVKAHEDYERARYNPEARGGVSETVQQPENDGTAGTSQSPGGETAQGSKSEGGIENAISQQTTGKMGVRQQEAVGEGVGRQNEPKEPTKQGKKGFKKPGQEENVAEQPEQRIYGTKNAITHELQDGMGLPRIEIPKDRSDDESLAAWKDGTRTPQQITEQLLDPNTDIYDKSITPNDEPIMREYIRQLGERGRQLNKMKLHAEKEGNEADAASITQQLNRHYADMQDALSAEQIGGNIWHKYGDERQKAINEQGQLINTIQAIRNNYGKDIPPDVEQKLKDLQAKYDQLQAKNEALQDRLTEQEAKKSIPKKASVPRDFKKERADIIEQMKRDFKKSFAKTYATIPGVPQLEAIAPHVAKLVRSYAEEGLHDVNKIIDKVHGIVKDFVDGITKDNIKDIIAGKYSQKRTLSDLNKEVNQIRAQVRLIRRIEEAESGIIEKAKQRGEASPEIKKLRDQLNDLKKEALNKYAHLSVQDLQARQATLKKQIAKGDFFKQPTVKRRWESDPEWIKNNREKANLIFELRKMEREAMNGKKSKFMRTLDWANRWGRRVIFFGANAVYTKLSSAAVLGSFLHRIPEQALGKLNAKMFPNIARTAPLEGSFNTDAEATWYKEFLNPVKFAKSAGSIFMTGETELSKELDTHPTGTHIPGLDLFAADAHQMIKEPVKRATFNAALKYQMDWYEKNGVDSTHPLIVESARQAAWARANYEVFQDNPKNQGKIKTFFNDLERSGVLNRNKPDGWNRLRGNAQYSAAALYHFFIPINTVPVNILRRIGLGISLPKTYLEAISKNKSVRDGILKMTNEESDALLLQLKKGQVMAAYWTLGFIVGGSMAGGLYTNFYPNKERDKDAVTPDSDYLNFRGVDVPKDVQHNSQYQALQMGATWNMIYNHYIDDKGESQMMAIFAASAATAGVAAKEHPVISTASNLLDAIQAPHGNTKWVQDLRRRVGVQKAQDVFKLMGYDIGDDSEDYKTQK